MTGNIHFFANVTLVFEDGKWVVAHKIILAASSLLLGKKQASASTDLYEGNSEQEISVDADACFCQAKPSQA